MATTLMQLRRMVRSRLGVPVADTFVSDEVLDDHINLAIATIEEDHRWPWQEKVATATVAIPASTITVPTDWRATRSLIYERQLLRELTPAQLFMDYTTTDTGTPDAYALVGGTIHIRPYADSAYSVTHIYYKTPTLLTADDSTPEMPGEYSPAIIAKAAELMAIREDDRGSAAAHMGEYMQWTDRMKKDTRRTTMPQVPRIRPGSWLG